MTELYDIKGCGNHGCQVAPPEGVGTNGACRCYKDRLKMQQVLHNHRILAAPECVEEVEEAYADAANTINEIYGASQFFDCPSFGLAQRWREDTHGGEMILAKRIVQPTGS